MPHPRRAQCSGAFAGLIQSLLSRQLTLQQPACDPQSRTAKAAPALSPELFTAAQRATADSAMQCLACSGLLTYSNVALLHRRPRQPLVSLHQFSALTAARPRRSPRLRVDATRGEQPAVARWWRS